MALYIRQLALGPMQNFVYLLGSADCPEAAVIDAAWDVTAIFDAAAADGRRLTHALVTHRHFDHTNGLEALLARQQMPIVIHPDEIPHVPDDVPTQAFQPMHDGDVIDVGGLAIRCIHTPGHTPGSVCFHVSDGEGALFTGDTLFVNHCGRCDFAGGDARQMFDSLTRVLGTLPGGTVMYPGHDYGDVPISSLSRERERNPYMLRKTVDDFVALRMPPVS